MGAQTHTDPRIIESAQRLIAQSLRQRALCRENAEIVRSLTETMADIEEMVKRHASAAMEQRMWANERNWRLKHRGPDVFTGAADEDQT